MISFMIFAIATGYLYCHYGVIVVGVIVLFKALESGEHRRLLRRWIPHFKNNCTLAAS